MRALAAAGAIACLAAALRQALASQAIPLTMPDFKPEACEARGPSAPVRGTFVELPLQEGSNALAWVGNATNATGWDFQVQASESFTCRHGLWPQKNTMDCLKGTWLMVIGASSANIWMVQLVNSLVADGHGLLTRRDGFNLDGVWTQMIDVVIDHGEVIYSNVVVDEAKNETHDREGVHSYVRSREVLRDKFKLVEEGPAFSSTAIRITHFSAEFWDEVGLALQAVEAEMRWHEAPVAAVLSLGLWYINSFNCREWDKWCMTRPSLAGRSRADIVEEFRQGMEKALVGLEAFCAVDGRAGGRGCVVTTMDHCFWMKGEIWQDMYDVVDDMMAERASQQLHVVDVWTLTSELGLDCIGEHQSPISVIWTWQVLLGSLCDRSLAAAGPVAVFRGELCRASQVAKRCKNYKEKGFKFDWECALSEPCELGAFASDQLAHEDYDACSDYMAVTGCGWTQQWSCRGQSPGSQGVTQDDGTVGYLCCCKYSLWDERRFSEAQTVPALDMEDVTDVILGLSDLEMTNGAEWSGGERPPPLASRIRGVPSAWILLAGAAVLPAAAAAKRLLGRAGTGAESAPAVE